MPDDQSPAPELTTWTEQYPCGHEVEYPSERDVLEHCPTCGTSTAGDPEPLLCPGCDGELDADGCCPTPGCTGPEPEPAPAAEREVDVRAEVLRTIAGEPEQIPRWLRTVIGEVLGEVPHVQLALARAAGQVGGVAKDRQADSTQGGYRFRGIDGILSAVHHPLSEAGILMVPRDLEIIREPWPYWQGKGWSMYRVHLEWEIFGPRGDSFIVTNWGEAIDNSDKGLGKARSYAQKDLLIRLLTIPTDDPDLADTEATRRTKDREIDAAEQVDGPPPPADPELIDEVQTLIGTLDETTKAKVLSAWKRAIGNVKPEHLNARQGTTARSLLRGMVADWQRRLEVAAAIADPGPAESAAESPVAESGSEDTAPAPDSSETAVTPESEESEPDSDDPEDEQSRHDEIRARAAAAAALREVLDTVDGAEVDRVGAEVAELSWQAVDRELRDDHGLDPAGLHIDIRRLALTTGRAAGTSALQPLFDEGIFDEVAAEPEPAADS